MSNVFSFGPFVGDIETELLVFIPFINWVRKTYNISSKYFVNSHYNRGFLYDDDVLFLPISNFITYEEEKQIKHRHSLINAKEYAYLNKVFGKYITNNKKPGTNNINLNIPYNDKRVDMMTYQKIHKPYNLTSNFPSKYVYIPDKQFNKKDSATIYNILKDIYKDELIVIGDKRTHLKEHNILLHTEDYVDNGYIYMFNYIMNAKYVFTPASHWTYIANLYHVPVFSYGKNVSLFKEYGDYNFNNKKCNTIPNTDVNIIINHIKNKGI